MRKRNEFNIKISISGITLKWCYVTFIIMDIVPFERISSNLFEDDFDVYVYDVHILNLDF